MTHTFFNKDIRDYTYCIENQCRIDYKNYTDCTFHGQNMNMDIRNIDTLPPFYTEFFTFLIFAPAQERRSNK